MLSVIIPTRNCERALVRTLAMLVGASVSGVVRDVVVADAGSSDETGEIAEIAGCTLLVSSAPLAARLREAVAAARGSWLLFLRPGTVLEAGWGEEVVRFIADVELCDRAETAAVFRAQPVAQIGRSFAAQALALLMDALQRTPTPEQGLVIKRRFYERAGGHRLKAGDPEADLLRRLGGGRLVRLRSGIMPFDEELKR
jgi:glycosyltransferase involved in cell wall biosynthesis